MARVLVIEDNPDNMELMTYLLNAFGHQTVSARDGQEGIAMARVERPELIVCDVHLPKADGYEVARTLKQDPLLKSIPLIAVTALAMVGDRDKVLAAGFDGYLAKPIAPETFVSQIEVMLPLDSRARQRQSPVSDTVQSYAEPNSQPTKKVRVLVVDDCAANREVIRSTLEPFGYDVELAASAREGLSKARQLTLNLILSDLHMPDEDGYHFIAAVKRDTKLSRLPFVFISASVFGQADRDRALALGADRFLLRPMEPQQLLNEVADVLGKYAVP